MCRGLIQGLLLPCSVHIAPRARFLKFRRADISNQGVFWVSSHRTLKKKKRIQSGGTFLPKEKYSSLSVMLPFLSPSFLPSFLPSFSVVFERTLSPDCFSVLCIIRGHGDISIKGKPHWEEFSNTFSQNQNTESPRFQLLTFVAIPEEKKF